MLFNNEPEMIEVAGNFLRITIVTYMTFGLVMVLMQCINGVGDTITPMIVTIVTMGGVMLPLAYFLPRITDLDVYGVRWAMVTGNLLRAVIYLIYFKMGRWKTKRI